MKAALYAILLTPLTVFAHPGPPGHVHEDEWPFDPLPLLVASLFAGALLLAGYLHRRNSAARV